jgi:HK97 family phage major capsid protein
MADNAFVRLPMYARAGLVVSTPTGAKVTEGSAVPVGHVKLSNVRLQPIRVGAFLVVTDELLLATGAAGQALLSREIAGCLSDAMDAAFFSAVVTGAPSVPSSGIVLGCKRRRGQTNEHVILERPRRVS